MAVLKIYGDISEGIPDILMDDSSFISAKDVSEFLDQTTDQEITVKINSRGGDVQEGWAIHDLLVNSGKKIKTIGEGKVYSIATIIFLAGEEREMMKNADGLIHNPFIPPYTLAGAYESRDLEEIAESLKQEEQKILSFYVARTGAPEEKLAEYMAKDTKLSAQDMLDLGFATKIIEPITAYAYLKPKHHIMDEKAFFEKLGTALDSAVTKIMNFSRVSTVDQTMKDKDGKEFKLEKESGAPAVGDKASPDGTYVMGDGKTITITDGTITSITEPQAKSELEIANEEIANLKAKITALEAEKPNLVAAEASFREQEIAAKALVTELTSLKNSWKPEGRTKFSSADKVGDVNLNRVRELKEKLNK